MNTAPKLQPGPDDDLERKKQEQQPEAEYKIGKEEETGVYTSIPYVQKANEARKAFFDRIRKGNGYFDRKKGASAYAKKLAEEKGEAAAKKYLKDFEEKEDETVREIAKRNTQIERTKTQVKKIPEGIERTHVTETDEEGFTYEHGAAPRSREEAEAKGKRIGNFLDESLESTKARVMEIMRPLELDAGDLLTKPGKDILDEQLEKPSLVIVESGGKKPVGMKTHFKGQDVYGFTSPGLQKKNGEFPENRDGFVIAKTKDGEGLHVIMTHGVSEGPESAALANTASVSAGYDLNSMDQIHLPEVFERANDMVNSVKKELDIPKQRLAMLGATIHKGDPGSPLYSVEVLSAGDVHCFVVDTGTEKVEQTTPSTVTGELQNAKLPMKTRNELLEKWSKNSGAPVEEIKKILTMSAGLSSEYFKPLLTGLTAAPGEIVVVATSDFMKSFGGEEYFQDGTVGKMIAERLKKGQKLGDILADLTKMVMKRQKDDKLEDYPVSIVAFEVPGKAKKAPLKPEQSVDEIMNNAGELMDDKVPLVLDFKDLEDTKIG